MRAAYVGPAPSTVHTILDHQARKLVIALRGADLWDGLDDLCKQRYRRLVIHPGRRHMTPGAA